jgi:hypothetical protein
VRILLARKITTIRMVAITKRVGTPASSAHPALEIVAVTPGAGVRVNTLPAATVVCKAWSVPVDTALVGWTVLVA